MSEDWSDLLYVVAAAPKMKESLEKIHALSVQDDDPDELLEAIRVEAVDTLREIEEEQG